MSYGTPRSSRERRIMKELQDIRNDSDVSGVSVSVCDGSDLSHLKGEFLAPPDTPYAGGLFVIDIILPDEYPFKAPAMKFVTKIWHPNISSVTGAICLDTLGPAWTPVQTIKSVLLSLRMLLENPNAKDPQDAEVAKMLLSNPELFARTAHYWAVVAAKAPATPDRTWPAYNNANIQRPPQLDASQYRGYNQNLVERFTNMGFDAGAVLDALELAGIERNNGMDYVLADAYLSDVTARLLGEH